MVFALSKKTAKHAVRKKRISGRWAFALIWLRRFGLTLAVLTAVLWAGAWLWLSGSVTKTNEWASHKILAFTNDLGFSVQNIMVEGRKNTDAAVLLGLMNIEEGDPLFSFNPKAAKKLIERITWVENVRIERRLPGTIYVDLIERVPLALYHDGKKLVLLDQKGDTITDHNLKRFKNLVMLSGKGAAQNAAPFIGLLQAEPDILLRVESAGRMGNRRWDLKFKNGITAQLPEEDAGFALRRMVEAQEKGGLLDKNIKGIDMRAPDRIIIRTRPGAVQEYKVNYNKSSPKSSTNI